MFASLREDGWLLRKRRPSLQDGKNPNRVLAGLIAFATGLLLVLLSTAIAAPASAAPIPGATVDGTFTCSNGVEGGTITGTGYGAGQTLNAYVLVGGNVVAQDTTANTANANGNFTSVPLTFTPGSATQYTLEIRRPSGETLASAVKTVDCVVTTPTPTPTTTHPTTTSSSPTNTHSGTSTPPKSSVHVTEPCCDTVIVTPTTKSHHGGAGNPGGGSSNNGPPLASTGTKIPIGLFVPVGLAMVVFGLWLALSPRTQPIREKFAARRH